MPSTFLRCQLRTVSAFFGGCRIVPKSFREETGNQEMKVALLAEAFFAQLP